MVKILILVVGAEPVYLNADEYVDNVTYRDLDGVLRTLLVHMLFGCLPDGTVTAMLVACPLVPSFESAMHDLEKAGKASPGMFMPVI